MKLCESDKQRFWQKVDKSTKEKCWNWNASKRAGYGAFKLNGKVVGAHRVSMEIKDGLAAGDLVLHKCDNKSCVNPNHLYKGDYSDNTYDSMERQGFEPAENAKTGEDHPDAKLTRKDIKDIRERYECENLRQQDLADEYNVCQKQISNIINEKNWS